MYIGASPRQGTSGGGTCGTISCTDTLITAFSVTANAPVYSTFLGGTNDDQGNAITVDASGAAYVAGITLSSNFPTASPRQGTFGGGTQDAFVAKLSQPTVALSAATLSIGEATGTATLNVLLSAAAPVTVTVNYATSTGSASAGSDYTAKSGTFSFAPGVTSQSTSITILNDALTEPNETVTLTLSAPANATLGNPNPATLTILDDETAPPPSDSYETYDALGNLIKHGLTNYGYGANGNGTGAEPHQARTVGGQAYTYDANGNLLTGGGRSFTWDHENRPSQIVNGALTETYAYDADGERISRTSGGTTTIYLQGSWEETTSGSVKQYYSLHGATVAVRDSATGVAYLHADHLGSISVASGAGAALLSRQAFGPWGTVASGGVSQTALNFTGQRLDSGSGLLYYHARYYDPALARFVSADTIVPGQADKAGTPNPQHLNRYTYVGNNPVSKTDPSGHDWEHLAQFAIGVAEGAISTVSSIVETSTPYGAARVGVNIGMAIGSDPAGFVQGVKDKVNTVIQGGKFAVSDPSGAVTALYEESRGLGRVLGTALGTAALGKAGKLITNEIAEDTVASVAPDLDNLDKHALQSMAKRNWTKDQIMEAFEQGEAYPAIDKTAGGASATRYIHPETGKSVIVNNETGRVIHVGKKGFIYDE